jgi:hypothetical protein
MEIESLGSLSKVVTIEVRNNSRTVCQVRGKSNRGPNENERKITQRWAEATGLRTPQYMYKVGRARPGDPSYERSRLNQQTVSGPTLAWVIN